MKLSSHKIRLLFHLVTKDTIYYDVSNDLLALFDLAFPEETRFNFVYSILRLDFNNITKIVGILSFARVYVTGSIKHYEYLTFRYH